MKLLATLALAQYSEACNLFTASCSLAGFTIKVDEACRKEDFSYVYFANSFMWGNEAQFYMDDPAGNDGEAVDSKFAGTCTYVKPITTGGVYEWQIPLGNCDMVEQYENVNKATTYKMYWNSQQIIGTGAASHKLMNLGQVGFTCFLKDHQVDASAVDIKEDTLVPDVDVDLNLAGEFKLEVNKEPAPGVNPAAFTPMQVNGGNSQITYSFTNTNTASVGDYMELQLVFDVAKYSNYAITMENCWASDSVNPLPTTDGESTFVDTKAFKLWNNFCPMYDGVAPLSGTSVGVNTAYLKEWWDQQTSMHKIQFSQFAFLDPLPPVPPGTPAPFSNVYLHCWIKICPIKDEGTCSLNAGCINPAPIAPGRRRRRSPGNEMLVSTSVGVKNVDADDCAKTSADGKVCIEAYTAAENSGNMALPTCLALAALPFLH